MEWWNVFIEQLLSTTWLEGTAAILGIASVYFSWKENIWVYPTGIVSVLIYVYITWQYGLFADTGANFYYFLMSVYGWYHWTNTNDSAVAQIPITRNSKPEHFLSIGIFLLAYALLAFVLLNFMNSDVPYWDSLTTSAAITGMWLMARKKIEHWMFWVLCNLTSIPLYAYKGLPFTSFQFLVFTVLAIAGWVSWRRKLDEMDHTSFRHNPF